MHQPDALPQHANFIFSSDLEDDPLQASHNDDIHGDSPPEQTDDAGGNMSENLISTPIREAPPHSTADISPIQQEAVTPDDSSKLQPNESISKS